MTRGQKIQTDKRVASERANEREGNLANATLSTLDRRAPRFISATNGHYSAIPDTRRPVRPGRQPLVGNLRKSIG